ncbi:MAG: 2-C-methyl-D-erythritol 4-phosphate cytidylyltransferase [Planctomycetota bacterium]
MSKFAVILAAAGKSSRFKDEHYKKPFAVLNRKAVWLHSADIFLKRDDVKQVIVVIAEDDRENFMAKFGANLAVLGIDVVLGGKERSDSVQNALKKVDDSIGFVAVHDAARPCVSDEEIENVFAMARTSNAAILATPVANTLKKSAPDKSIAGTVDRSGLWNALTPQVFEKQLLLDAYSKLGEQRATDDAQVVELTGQNVSLVEGSPLNIKITTKRDLNLAAACMAAKPKPKLNSPAHPFADDNLWQ